VCVAFAFGCGVSVNAFAVACASKMDLFSSSHSFFSFVLTISARGLTPDKKAPASSSGISTVCPFFIISSRAVS
jgi:hypothetical protein